MKQCRLNSSGFWTWICKIAHTLTKEEEAVKMQNESI